MPLIPYELPPGVFKNGLDKGRVIGVNIGNEKHITASLGSLLEKSENFFRKRLLGMDCGKVGSGLREFWLGGSKERHHAFSPNELPYSEWLYSSGAIYLPHMRQQGLRESSAPLGGDSSGKYTRHERKWPGAWAQLSRHKDRHLKTNGIRRSCRETPPCLWRGAANNSCELWRDPRSNRAYKVGQELGLARC